MNHPVTDGLVMVLIVVSVVLLVVEESMPLSPGSWIPEVSQIVTLIFAVELGLRFLVAKKKRRFFKRYWPDLLALLPLLRPLRFFRFLRLLRLFRLFQLGLLLDRRVTVLRGVLRVNFYFLWALLVMTLILVVGSAVVVFLLEQGQGGDFQDVQQSMWWALYAIIAGEPIGDMPQTTYGRAVLALMMLSGMSLFAVFTGMVSATMMARLQASDRITELDLDELENHILIFGWNSGVPALLAELALDTRLNDRPIVLVNELEARPDLESCGYRSDLLYWHKGNYTQVSVLEEVGVRNAAKAVVMADDVRSHSVAERDARSVLTALTIEKLAETKKLFCVVELMDRSNEEALGLVDIEAVVMRSELSGRALASACRHPQLMNVLENLLTMSRGEVLHRIPGPTAPTPFGTLLTEAKAERNVLVVGVVRDTDDGVLTEVNPSGAFTVQPSDQLIVIGGPKAPA